MPQKPRAVRAADKIRTREDIAPLLPTLRAQRGKIVFTNGVFDLLHVGHVRYLEFARSLGGVLVVGINSDASAAALEKGSNRPVVPAGERAEIIAALECVDFACIFEELRPDATLRVLRPDIHVKGGAYAIADLPEAATVAEIGGEIVLAPQVEGRSTSALLKRIQDSGAR